MLPTFHRAELHELDEMSPRDQPPTDRTLRGLDHDETLVMRHARALLCSAIAVPALLVHARLTKSIPADKSELRDPPRVIRLWFSEKPVVAFSRIELFGPDSQRVDLGPVTQDTADVFSIEAEVRSAVTTGRHAIVWQTAGKDGHPLRGRLWFVVLPPVADTTHPTIGPIVRADTVTSAARDSAADATMLPRAPDDASGSAAQVGLRAVTLAALLTVIGAVGFHFLVVGAGRASSSTDVVGAAASTRAAALGLAAALALALAALGRLVAQTDAVVGRMDGAFIADMLGGTLWGAGWLLQLGGAVAAAVGFWMARRSSRAGWTLAAIAALVLAVTPALGGHAAALPRWAASAVAIDTLHVIGAAGWLGTLLVLVVAGLPAAISESTASDRGPLIRLVAAFSRAALAFAALAATTGVVSAWLRLGALAPLWQTDYGRTLLWKLAVLLLVAAAGAYNWKRVRPLLGDAAHAAHLRRSATLELSLGALVILITAVLVGKPL